MQLPTMLLLDIESRKQSQPRPRCARVKMAVLVRHASTAGHVVHGEAECARRAGEDGHDHLSNVASIIREEARV